MGLTDLANGDALSFLMPNGTTRYLALLTGMPLDSSGAGATEAAGGSYARLSVSSWITTTAGGVTYRKNNGNVTFGALTSALNGIVGWALYDAVSLGNMIAFGFIRDVANNPVTKNFVATDQPQFQDQQLQIGLGNAT